MDFKQWQKDREKCTHRFDKPAYGFWCSINNKKCAFSNCTHPFVSCGTNNNQNKDTQTNQGNIRQGVTNKQEKAFKLRKQGLTYQNIANIMGVSKKQAYKHFSNYCKRQGVTLNAVGVTNRQRQGVTKHKIRLHNDEIKISMNNILNRCEGKLINLKHCSYVLKKTKDYTIRFFNKCTIIRFKSDIIADTEKEAEIKANNRIKTFLKRMYGLNQYVQLKRHYGLLGSQLAKTTRKQGIEVIVYDDTKQSVRQRIDFSHEKYEIDSEDVLLSRTDSEKTNSFLGSIIKKPHYLPHETKLILDTILNVQEEYAYQIRKHLEVQNQTLKVLKKMETKLR